MTHAVEWCWDVGIKPMQKISRHIPKSKHTISLCSQSYLLAWISKSPCAYLWKLLREIIGTGLFLLTFFIFCMPQFKCVPKTRNQNWNLKIFLVNYLGLETSQVFTQNKEPAVKTVHGHSEAQVLTRNVGVSRRRVWFNSASRHPLL